MEDSHPAAGPSPGPAGPGSARAAAQVVITADVPVEPVEGGTGGPAEPPFTAVGGEGPARIVLRQVDATTFELVEGFRYRGPSGTWTVNPADLAATDLASIPQFLGWFVSRYGRHTLAALLHDHLVRNGARLDPPVARYRADEVFLEALTLLDVAYLRSRIMWSAVTFATRWRSSGWGRLLLAIWMTLAAIGIVTLGAAIVGRYPVPLAVALLAPVPAAVLWGPRRFRAGVIGGYTLWLITLPALGNVAAYGLYEVLERLVRRWRLHRPRRYRRPVTQVAKPPPYTAR
jgi:hypothetical protein